MQKEGLLAATGFLLLVGSMGFKPRPWWQELIIRNDQCDATDLLNPFTHLYANNADHLANLAVFDSILFQKLNAVKAIAPLNSTTRRLIEDYLEDYNDSNGVAQGQIPVNMTEETGNPISVYRLMRRCHLLAPQIIKEAGMSNNGLELTSSVINFPLPAKDDVLETIDAILRIQWLYRMNVTQFASGNIFKSRGLSRLKGVHCLEIGKRALEQGQATAAVEWFQEAKRLAVLDQSVTLQNTAIDKKIRRAKEQRKKGLSERDRLRIEQFYVRLCSGEDLKTSDETSSLFCWLEFKINAQFRIGPLKMEFLNRYPLIVRILNAVFPGDIEKMKSGVGDMLPSPYVVGKDRTWKSGRRSTSALLPSSVDLRWSRKIGRLLDLNAVSSRAKDMYEFTQVTSYTAGGHFAHHHDAYGHTQGFASHEGNRLVTFTTYLNTVDQGGYTVFPFARTYAEPIRGSAIFWFNLFSSGHEDYSMHHIGCPVVKGQKWIATKWIAMYDQFLKKQCLLEPMERFQVPVNGKYLPVPDEIRERWTKNDEDERTYKPSNVEALATLLL